MPDRLTEVKPVIGSQLGAVPGSVAVSDAESRLRSRPVEVLAPNVLRTSRMILRPLRDSDRDGFLAMLEASRVELDRWVRPHRDGESDAQLFERQLQMCKDGDSRGAAARRVAILDDGRMAGCFNLNSITRGLIFEADFTWWVASDLTGQGLGTEAAQAMFDLAFMDLPRGLGLHRVQAAIHPENARSLRMAAKLGLARQPGATVSILMGEMWQAHDLYAKVITG